MTMRGHVFAALLILSSATFVSPLLGLDLNPVLNRLINTLIDFIPVIFHAQRLSMPLRDDSSAREQFDFIIVGSGPSGSALALRLTERADWNVLLLEAGGEQVPIMTVPFFLGQFHGTDANWHYVTSPQTSSCVLMDESKCDYPAGRVLGGSSTINYMFAIRGNPKDYDNWAAMGNAGWSFDEVLPYFRKVEDMKITDIKNSKYRGYGGKIKISYPPYESDVARLILQGNKEAGFPLTEDYNGAQQTGAARIQTTTYKGQRWSAYSGYLEEVRKRPNLFLRAKSQVTRLLLEGNHAKGVRYVRDGQEMQAFASKEVILSAGAVNSPAILMHSGIGPAEHLRELGIPLVKDLPVGYNLMDHVGTMATFTTLNRTVSPGIVQILLDPRTYFDYFVSGSGPLSVPGAFEVVGFHDLEGTPYHSPGWPEVEIIYSSVNPVPFEAAATKFRFPKKAYQTMFSPIQNTPVIMAGIWRCRPKSRGRVSLINNDPLSPPLIDLKGLSDPEDVEVVLAGVRDFQKILATPSFQRVGAKMIDSFVPECGNFTYDSDDYWRCAIRHVSVSIYHPSGTCKMGPSTDPTSVVTSDLRVKGMVGLRVVDSSIMPLLISGHNQIPAYMIGERAADFIKEQYKT